MTRDPLCISGERRRRRRIRAMSLLAVLSALLGTSVALAADQFPDPNTLYQAEGGGDDVWIALRDGYAHTVTMQDTSINFVNSAWEMKFSKEIVANHDLGLCDRRDGILTVSRAGFNGLACMDTFVTSVHLRLADLGDMFVGGDRALKMDIRGEAGSDYIRTSKGKDQLDGGGGKDVLRSGDNIDTLLGGADDDILDGGRGADLHECGDGSDTAQYQGRASKVTVTLDDVANDGESGEGDNVKKTCENVEGWNGPDVLTGSTGSNRLFGRDGNDTLSGGGGDDWLWGSNGNDTLRGDAGSDRIHGEAGADTITGGAGADTLWGDDGNDIINGKGDGFIDTIYCGGGLTDVVYADATDRVDIGTCEQIIH